MSGRLARGRPEEEIVSCGLYRATEFWRAEVIGFTIVMIVDWASLETQKLFEVRDFHTISLLTWAFCGNE